MGHIRLGELPRTRKWEQVVELIKLDGDATQVAAAALDAAETGFKQAAEDEGLGRATWLLTQLPLAARVSVDALLEGIAATVVEGIPRVGALVGGSFGGPVPVPALL